MNDDFVRLRSADFAKRVAAESSEDNEARVTQAFRVALGREPSAEERDKALTFLAAQSKRHSGDEDLALDDFCQILFGMSEFLYVD